MSTEREARVSTQHTPGPWALFPFAKWIRVTADNDNVAVADLWYGNLKNRTQAEADARLIAAAPELLAALKRAISSRTLSIDFDHNRTPEACDVRRQIIEAIDKAEGNAP